MFLPFPEFPKNCDQKGRTSSFHARVGRALLPTGSAMLLPPTQCHLRKPTKGIRTWALRTLHPGPDFSPWPKGLQELPTLAPDFAKSNPPTRDSCTLVSSLVLQGWDGSFPGYWASAETTIVHTNVPNFKSWGRGADNTGSLHSGKPGLLMQRIHLLPSDQLCIPGVPGEPKLVTETQR